MQQLELLCQSEGLDKHTGGKYLSIAQTTVAWDVVGPNMSQQSSASMDHLPQQTHVAQQIWRDKLRIQGFQQGSNICFRTCYICIHWILFCFRTCYICIMV